MGIRWLNIETLPGAWRLLRDGSSDWAPIFRTALSRLLAEDPTGGTLYLPPGHYRIDSPIFIARLEGGAYQPVTVTITGEAEDDTGRVHGSVIVPSYENLPALIVQGGQSVTLRKLLFLGKNLRDSGDVFFNRGPDGVHLSEELEGIDPYVLPSCRDQRSSPYAAVCIDPFHLNVEKDERYPGLEGQYLPGPPSQDVRIEDCHMTGFVVGVCVSPSGRDFPALQPGQLTLRMTNSVVVNMKSCVSISGPRQAVLESVGLGHARHSIDCVRYDGGQGRPGFCPSIYGANIGFVKYIFRTGNAGAEATICGMFIEATLSLGQFGTQPRSPDEPMDHYTLSGCSFTISTPQENQGFDRRPDPMRPGATIDVPVPRPLPAVPAHLLNFADVRLLGCSLKPNRGGRQTATEAPVHLVNHGVLSLEGCSLGGGKVRQASEMPGAPPRPELGASFWVSGDMERVTLTNCDITDVLVDSAGNLTSAPVVLSSRQTVPSFLAHPYITAQAWPGALYGLDNAGEIEIEQVLDDMGALSKSKSLGSPLRWVAGEFPLIPLAKADGTLHTLRELNLRADGTGGFICEGGKIVEGDVLLVARPWPNALVEPRGEAGPGHLLLGRVVRVSPGDGSRADDVSLEFVPVSLLQDAARHLDDTVPLFIAYFPRIHPATVGDITGGRNVIDNVRVRPIDAMTNLPSVPIQQAWAHGHRISGEQLPMGGFVTKVEADKITISLPIPVGTPNKNDVRIFDADIQGMVNQKR